MSANRVLITGTTSGIGRALLDYYVKRGTAVISVNRRRVAELETLYPSVRFECVDVRSEEDVGNLIRGLAATDDLPEVFILNAGINRVDNDESFQVAPFREVVDTNLYGVLHFVQPLTIIPATKVQRHLVAISSLASYVGNPYGLGYHSSKKALTACFEVWANMYPGTDLVFQQVLLGPVRTGIYTMADRFPGWMVWLKDLFSANLGSTVCAIAKFALTRKKKLVFPGVLSRFIWACGWGSVVFPASFKGEIR